MKRGPRLHQRKLPLTCRAPLRNRTVDLLLTIDRRTIPLPQVEGVTRQNTSTDQHPQAPDRPTRASFAPQSATHFDLVPPVRRVRPRQAHGHRLRHETFPQTDYAQTGGSQGTGAAASPAVLLRRKGQHAPLGVTPALGRFRRSPAWCHRDLRCCLHRLRTFSMSRFWATKCPNL
jgi:hypothetical protein